jgi:hypothetical protein
MRDPVPLEKNSKIFTGPFCLRSMGPASEVGWRIVGKRDPMTERAVCTWGQGTRKSVSAVCWLGRAGTQGGLPVGYRRVPLR